MAKKYTGSLNLDWFNKQKSILIQEKEDKTSSDIPAPIVNWINKDEALFYEVLSEKGKGNEPYWVSRNDIRVKESRPLVFQSSYSLEPSKSGDKLVIGKKDDHTIENILIKGDNLLSLNSLKKIFDQRSADEKAKCIYLDPPYTTGNAFEHYDDNLNTSEWLTLMRDRLIILKDLMSEEGVIFIQLDQKNIFHLKLVLDEVFGSANFVNFFTIKTSDPSGLKTVNPSPYDSAEYVIMYAKNKTNYKYETIYVPCAHDFGYNKFITNIDDDYKKWEIISVAEAIAEEHGFDDVKAMKAKTEEVVIDEWIKSFSLQNAKSIFQATAISNKAGNEIVKARDVSKSRPDKIVKVDRESDAVYILNGRQLAFYSKKVKMIDGKLTPTMHLTNIWTDIPYNGISAEGNVEFKESKKPEKLLKRVFEIANLKPGDLVIDCFGGSGTTFAVAHKMNLKWIGVEIGNHAETHIVERLKGVVKGEDKTGVSNSVDWKGGGSFKFYKLGESIIKQDKNGLGDFNWKLGKGFIEESLLSTYDFVADESISLSSEKLFQDKEALPKVGFIESKSYCIAGIVSLCTPNEKNQFLSNEEILSLVKEIRKHKKPTSITLFTNKGIEMASESKPEDLEVIKVPNAIFSQLEK